MKDITYLVLLVISFSFGALSFRSCDRGALVLDSVTYRDTLVVRDTIRLPVPVPMDKGVVRVETVKPKIKPVDERNSDEGTVIPEETINEPHDAPTASEEGFIEIPVERKEYVTDDYRAVIEGWRPSLVSIEIYPKTTTITRTIAKKQRFNVVVGPGIGFDGKSIKPYIGVTVGLVIFR